MREALPVGDPRRPPGRDGFVVADANDGGVVAAVVAGVAVVAAVAVVDAAAGDDVEPARREPIPELDDWHAVDKPRNATDKYDPELCVQEAPDPGAESRPEHAPEDVALASPSSAEDGAITSPAMAARFNSVGISQMFSKMLKNPDFFKQDVLTFDRILTEL